MASIGPATAPTTVAARGPGSRAASLSELRRAAVARNLVRPGGARSIAHLLGILTAWAALVVIGQLAATMWVWVPLWVSIAFLIIGLAGVGHDCVHASIVSSKRANAVIGHLVMFAIALPFRTYRQFHLLHHADTLGPEDPEGPPANFTTRLEYVTFHALLGPAFVAMIWWSTIRGAFRSPPAWARTERSRHALRSAWFPALPVLVAFAYASTTSELFRHLWLYPWLFVLVPVFPFVLLSEHYAGEAGDGILGNTYTLQSNPVTRFAVFNINFHTAHHQIPRVPGVRLREFDELVAPHAAHRAPGYLAFHRQVLAPLPWRTRRPGHPSGGRQKTD